MTTYGRIYRIFGFATFALIDLIFSVALSQTYGLLGFILPSMMVVVAYLAVECVLDLVITWLDYRNRIPRRNSRS
jgi:hypothetical protein